MRKTLLAGAAAFALAAVPSVILAQATPQGTMTPVPAPNGTTTVTTTETTTAASGSRSRAGKPFVMTVQQKTVYATWPSERRSGYEAWPIEYKTYYWTLTPEQQQGYWAMTPDQRGQIYKMTPEQRALAWQAVRQQMTGHTPTTPMGQANPPGRGMPTAGVPNPQSAAQPAPPAMPADENYQGGPYKGALTPPPAAAMGKDYPVCGKGVTDGCVNRGGK